MDHEINVVQQYPLSLAVPFHVRRSQPGLPESLLYLIGDGLNLPRVATGANNKKIGEPAGGLIELQNGQIFGLFRLARGHCLADLFFDFGFFGRHVTSDFEIAKC